MSVLLNRIRRNCVYSHKDYHGQIEAGSWVFFFGFLLLYFCLQWLFFFLVSHYFVFSLTIVFFFSFFIYISRFQVYIVNRLYCSRGIYLEYVLMCVFGVIGIGTTKGKYSKSV